ncbi:MAG: iron complex transport system substrate-binding protein [Lentimonas sp.]|jgi:iron complex transport system substrate-binding protein
MIKWTFLFLLITLVLSSCQSKTGTKNIDNKGNIIRYAKNLSIVENDGQTIIQILAPDDQKVENTYILDKNHKPFTKIAALSSTHIGMLNKLDAISFVVGISNSLYTYNKQLLKKIGNGEVTELGEESQIPVESIIKSGTQAIFYSGFGKGFPHEEQLKKAGVDCIVNYDWRELHPLGKAEWILLFGYLLGKEEIAQAYFDRIEKEYNQLKKEVSKVKDQPTVLSGNLWSDIWYTPAGESFHALMLDDAKAKYVYADTEGSGSLALTLEKVIKDNESTEFWINPGMPTKKMILQSQKKIEFLNPMKNGNVYDYSKSGNLYWEMSAIEPQKVLSDYIKIFHPEKRLNTPFYFYYQVK